LTYPNLILRLYTGNKRNFQKVK